MKSLFLSVLLIALAFSSFSQLTTPTLSSPASATTFYVGSTINFNWTPVAGANSYDVEFDSGMGYEFLTNVSGTSFNLLLAAANVGPHTWHVRAKNSTTVSAWSSTRSYNVVGIPAIPITTNPLTDTTIQFGVSTFFNWNQVANASEYKIQFDNETPVNVSGTNYSRSFSTLGVHTWKVLASNQAGSSDWSAPKTLTVVVGVPSLSSPASGSTFYVGSTLSLSWTTVAGATSYEVEFDAGLGFSSTSVSTTTSLNLPLTSANAGQHTWHVRAKNGTATGQWSNSRNYVVADIPDVPTTTNPTSGTVLYYDVTTNFTWTSVLFATSYQLQFDADPPITVTNTNYNRVFTTLGIHTWKVKALNTAGSSDWSTAKTLIVSLNTPNLASPANGSTVFVGSTLNFSWSSIPGATSYDVEFDTGLGIETATNVTAPSLSLVLTTAHVGPHTWRVRAKLNSAAGPWTGSRNYTVVTIPAVPGPQNPASGSTFNFETQVAFNWSQVPNATNYQIQFDSYPPITVSNANYSRSFSVLGNHTWKVKATNAAGDSEWSTPRTVIIILGTPNLSSPANGTVYYVGNTITLSWTTVPGATSYEVEFDSGMGYTTVIPSIGSSVDIKLSAANAGPHTWHVRAKNGSFVGNWSNSRNYTVIGIPDAPTLINPANDTKVFSEISINFNWSNVAYATGYQIQFDAEQPVTVSGTSYSRIFTTIGIHTWKVRATNSAGNSDWSIVNYLNVTYGIPNLISPANQSVYFISSTISFSWTTIPGATSYDIEIDAGTPQVSITNLSGGSLDIPVLAANVGPHTWHVRARYGTTAGQWSTSRSYVVLGIPAIPTTVNPANNAIVYVDLSTNFNWNGVNGASSYLLQIDSETPVTVSTTTYTKIFTTQGSHTWKVKAVNAAGESDWSTVKSFIVSSGAPNIPSKIILVYPDNSWDYQNVTVGSANEKTFLVQNTGSTQLTISNLFISGADADQFEITNPTGTNFSLPSGGMQQVTISFKPSSAGLKNAFLTITNNSDNASPAKLISLAGTGSILQTKTLTVEPDGALDFGNVTVNNSPEKTFSLKNSGTSTLSITGLTISGNNADQYTISSPAGTVFDIPAGGVQLVKLRFKPTSAGVKNASLTISNNSDNSSPSKQITLNGTGTLQLTKTLSVNPDVLTNFGTVTTNTSSDKIITLQNTGSSIITVSGLALTGLNPNQFSIVSPTVTSIDIPVGGVQQITIRFIPTSEGWKSSVLTITNNSDNSSPTKIITLNGTGSLLPTMTMAVNPDGYWDFGNIILNTNSDKIITIRNNGLAPLSVTGFSLTGTNSDQFAILSLLNTLFEIPAGGFQQITIRFSPSSDGWKSSFLSVVNNSDNASPVKLITLNGTGVLRQAPVIPTVTTNTINSVSSKSAAGGGNVTSDGGSSVAARGLCWSTTANPTVLDSKTTDGSGIGAFTSNITGLIPGTIYHVRAYATNPVGTAYGNDITFTTHTLATVSTTPITATSSTAATGGGSISSDGGTPVTIKGICWNKTGNPTISDSKTSDGSGNATFISSIFGLTIGTTYHARAYATNSVGTNYGADIVFTTLSLPVVTTISAIAIVSSSTTASGKGNVSSDGGTPVTEKGLCWSTSPNPTTLDLKTSDGNGLGSFTDLFTGLTPWTNYHVRAYATNAVGTSYGADITFQTSINGGVFDISSFYQIYPNPSYGQVTILSKEEIPVEMAIYSLDGALIHNYKFVKQQNSLNLNLTNGVYIITLKSEKATGSYRLIIL